MTEKAFVHVSVPIATRKRLRVAADQLRINNDDKSISMSTVLNDAITAWLQHQHMPPELAGAKDKLMVRIPVETREQLIVAMSNLQVKAKTFVSMSAIVDEAINRHLDDEGL